MDYSWRFVSRYSVENGLDTSDMETFKKDPNASLAREIAQNSIDAANGERPVRIEFKVFSAPRESIPGIDELSEEIEKTYAYVQDSNKDKRPLEIIKKAIASKEIKCLRISDFNTKGLVGVSTNNKESDFYKLTKGSGVSNKAETAGGSKGIGKFATFVASSTNTVFYSTVSINGEQGYIGISKLRSRQEGDDPDLLTEGTGYYADGNKNLPIQGKLVLDQAFDRSMENPGTDIYIIGFKDRAGWKESIISKVLESFMAAILKGRLEVLVDDVLINKESAESIIYESGMLLKAGKKAKKDIEAQFELLHQGEEQGVYSKNLIVGDGNEISVYVKQYSSKESDRATKHCVMIRYPYMKILYTMGHSFLPYSALCIIHKNDLNKRLRIIENPQHTDWEIKRLNEEPEEKEKTKKLRQEMELIIDNYIEEVLQQNVSEQADMEGAGEFLPAENEEIGEDPGSIKPDEENEEISITPIKRVKATGPKTSKLGIANESLEFETGGEDGDEGKTPSPPDDTPEPNPLPSDEPKDDDTGGRDGDQPVIVKTQLSGMRYRIIVTDKRAGKYDVSFISSYDEGNCEMSLRQFGASDDKYPVGIISATLNGEQCKIEDGNVVQMRLEKDKNYTVSCEVDVKNLFAGEVVMYAYR